MINTTKPAFKHSRTENRRSASTAGHDLKKICIYAQYCSFDYLSFRQLSGQICYKFLAPAMSIPRRKHMMTRSVKLALWLVLNSLQLSAFAQTNSELPSVEKVTGREQSKSSALSFSAGLLEAKGDYKSALDNYQKILEIYKNDPGIGANSARAAWAMSKIAVVQNKAGKKEDAARKCKEALALIDGQTPDNNPDEGNYIVMTRQNCLMVLDKDMPPKSPPHAPKVTLKPIAVSEIEDLDEREKQVAELLSLSAKKKDNSSQEYLKRALYLANIYTLKKKYKDAEPLFKKVISALEKKFGKSSAALLNPLSNYGYMLSQAGRKLEAETLLKRMKTIAQEK